ncbi:DMT family transporter [Maritalea mediterranea]|uniref:DMT family transporter n=1 Tax=Maritalea mediterranea TaxID=2909667 RepID=A0ABS9E8C8_9HYPH|nr:DMT family transporter [Maritalea mediterranea]MCF4099132.1 DMT family transporter [Maritalea mediterranea]
MNRLLHRINPSALGLALLAMFAFALMDALAKVLVVSLPVGQVAFLRTLGSALLFLGVALWGQHLQFAGVQWRLHVLRAAGAALVTLCMYFALAHFALVTVAAFALTGQLISTLYGVLFFKERFDGKIGLALIVGMAGALLFLISEGLFSAEINLSLLPLLALIAVPILEATLLAFLKFHTQKEGPILMSAIQLSLSALILSPGLMHYVPLSMGQWGILAVTCVVGAFAGYWSVIALKQLPVGVFAITDNTSVVWAALLGLVLFSHVPTPLQWAGAALIFASCYFLSVYLTPESES